MESAPAADPERSDHPLHDRARFLERVAHATHDIIFVYDLIERRVRYLNHAVEEMLGYPAHELQAQTEPGDVLIHPDDRESRRRYLESFRNVADRELREYEHRTRAADGRYHWILTRASVFSRTEDGRPKEIVGVASDITQRKLAESAARESESRFRALADSAPVMIWVTEPDGRCVYLNKPWYDFTGQAPDGGLGLGWVEATHPDDRAMAKKAFLEATRSQSDFRIEYRLRRHDGVYRWAIDSAAPRFGPDGEFLGFVGSVIDITERQEAENEMRRSEALLAAVVKQLPVGLGMCDTNGAWLLTNALMREFAPGSIPSNSPEDRTRWRARDEHGAEVSPENWPGKRALRGETVSPGAEMLFTDDSGGERWMRVSSAPLRNADEQIVGATVILQDIDAVKRSEEALRESEERLRKAISIESVGVLFFDLSGRIHETNATLQRMTGYTAEELRTLREWGRLTPPEFREVTRRAAADLAERGITAPYEKQWFRKDGSRFWGLFAPTRLRGQGDASECVEFIIDITERKRAEALVEESEMRQSFLVRLGDALRTLSAPLEIETTATRLLGEHLGANRVAYFDVRGSERAFVSDYTNGVPRLTKRYPFASLGAHKIEMYRQGRTAVSHDVASDPAVAPQERETYASLQIGAYIGVPLVKDGELVAGLAIHAREPRDWKTEDIVLAEETAERTWAAVERARTMEALRASEERFRAAASAVSSIIWTNNAYGEMEGEQPGWGGFTGQTREEYEGYGWARAVHPEDAQPTVDSWNQAVAEKRMFEFEHRVRRRDGAWRLCSIRAVPVFDEHGDIREWVGVHNDITEQRHAEERLERTVEERTAKLRETIAELEAFSYSIAHDMRAPLRSLQGFSEALLSDYADKLDAEGQSHLRRISRSAGRMDALIQDVLSYSRVVRGEWPLEPVNVEQLLHGIADTYPMLAPEKAEIVLEGAFPDILGSEAMLMQVFSNLLGNAVKFVRPGTKPHIRVWAEPRGEHVRVFVRDNGIGIAPEEHGKIFGIFHQVGRNYEGTGIGLAIVKKAVERMNGKVGVDSALGRGTTFWVELQRA